MTGFPRNDRDHHREPVAPRAAVEAAVQAALDGPTDTTPEA